MNELKITSSSFEETLKNTDLQDVTGDLAEVFTDSLLSDGVLKDIPIISSIIGLTRTAVNITDRLLIKKILYFLSELNNIDLERRNKMITDIDNSEKHKIKVGEKILYILDKCYDHISAKYLGFWFRAFLVGRINYDDFLKGAAIIQKIYIDDFEMFIQESENEIVKVKPKYGFTRFTEFQNSLISAGLCIFDFSELNDYKSKEKELILKKDFIGTMLEYSEKLNNLLITKVGALLREVFKE